MYLCSNTVNTFVIRFVTVMALRLWPNCIVVIDNISIVHVLYAVTRGVATGGYIGIYTLPKSVPGYYFVH